ncbi:Malectin-like domain [Arabidopsis suecica]|uniref:Malectin-like domain n=1 Tax=Arabidopsis suecica TaxID=45249 RepID=A0A8T1YQG0_ARASU|nr:Malectin-like domain [Arabidopsis suecica]
MELRRRSCPPMFFSSTAVILPSTSTTMAGIGSWKSEDQKILSSNLVNASYTSEASYQKSGVSRIPYMKARIFRSAFTYSFPVTPGWKFLRLYFYPTQYKSGFDAVNSFFSVNVNGFTLLRNFNADITVQASITESSSLIKEFIISVYQTLNLTFTPSENSLAFVNGVEIVSMPDRFYSKGGFDDVVRNVSSDVDFEIDNSTAFETVHRVNVGGQMVNDVDDSGMFRRWIPDDSFGNSGSIVNVPDVKITYTEKTPAYVAPYDVYATSRSMGNSNNLIFNLTGMFLTVDAGYNYLVRLHFCETLPQVTKPSQRVFSILVRDKMAKKETDVIRLSGGPRIPVYLDFSVYVGFESGMRQPELRLDLHAFKDTNLTDAILSGVEILKLNDSEGNLARPNQKLIVSTDDSRPNHSNVTPPIKGKPHVLVIILIAVGSVIGLATFIVIIMLLIRRKKNKKENSVIMFKLLLKQYTYAELKKITKSFPTPLGKEGLEPYIEEIFLMGVRLQ